MAPRATKENCDQAGGLAAEPHAGGVKSTRPVCHARRRAALSQIRRGARRRSGRDLVHASARGGCAAGTIPPPVHDDRDTAKWIAQEVIAAFDRWVAETSFGALVGLLVLDRDWLEQLYVDPDLTGQGVGGTLLTLAKRERPDGLRLWTFVSNLGAQRFYLRHGFLEVERTNGSRNEEHAPDIQYAWRP